MRSVGYVYLFELSVFFRMFCKVLETSGSEAWATALVTRQGTPASNGERMFWYSFEANRSEYTETHKSKTIGRNTKDLTINQKDARSLYQSPVSGSRGC